MNKVLPLLLMFALSMPALAGPEQNIKTKLNTMMPELTVDSVEKSPIPNLYTVSSGGQVLYMTADAKYIIQGDVYDVQDTAKPINISDNVRQIGTKQIIDKVDPATMIIYPASPEKTAITVFTDIDCAYCRALHKEVKELNAAGITVRYMAFPRTAKGTPSYNKAIYVWCAPDRNTALTEAKNGKDPVVANCTHPVDQHHVIAAELGVNVTPVVIMGNGKMIPGYLPASQMIKAALENA